MRDLPSSIQALVQDAVDGAFGSEAAGVDPAVHRSAHADYQADVALGLARRIGGKPREVADRVVEKLPAGEILAGATVSGPGFINLTVRPEYLARALAGMMTHERLGVELAQPSQTAVVDYSSPNLAKEMHVGHLRSSIIGDALVRILGFAGHTVIRQNHLGDWGTPFGMLIEHMLDEGVAEAHAHIAELSQFYRAARAKFDSDPAFADRARRRVVMLQAGDEATLALWRRLIDATMEHLGGLYRRLSLTMRPEDAAGESGYNDRLADVLAELRGKGLITESEGAACVFLPGFTGRDGKDVPLIVQKQDGGFGYAITDLAAIRHRIRDLHASRIIYVVGAPQAQHFAMVFATAKLAGWVGETVSLEHVAFGSVLGPDKKILKSRAGDTVSLSALLDEAVTRAQQAVDAKSPSLDEAARVHIAEAVGIGAVKYADLSSDRIKDYVFDWNRLLAFEGNTAPYLMYAHARIRSILRKATAEGAGPGAAAPTVIVEDPAERALVLELLAFPATIARAGESLQPHRLCGYLYSIATAFTGFYENCPVLKAEGAVRASRLALCDITARALAQGLNLLGIEPLDQM